MIRTYRVQLYDLSGCAIQGCLVQSQSPSGSVEDAVAQGLLFHKGKFTAIVVCEGDLLSFRFEVLIQ